ncbi:MAG: glucose-1-phosphate adenylyltransferase subunit GlgD, partial [Oscillospiraceae bacterium]|nr:glucose-1-phosphate adenylyltransferase subunit GlgD [Oscillospiraceae bacterium]
PIRTLSAARFYGRYRLVDFMLSNMVNSSIYTIGMILNSHYQSLIEHIGMGKEWDLARKSGGVTFFPPYYADERQSVNSELDGPLQRAAEFLTDRKDEYIVLADSSIVYNMNYRQAFEAHKKNNADVTAIYTKKTITSGERENTAVFTVSEEGRVTGIGQAPLNIETINVSLGAYIMHKRTFIQLTAGERNCGMQRFSRILLADALDRLKVMGYEFKGYTAHICSVETFFHYNLDVLDMDKRNSLFDFEGRQIFTNLRDSLPAKYGKQADIKNSVVADGCRIDGTVINSIICRNVKIAPGAVVRNCVLQDDTVVENNASLDCIITDRSVKISENRKMMGYRTYPVYIERGRVI